VVDDLFDWWTGDRQGHRRRRHCSLNTSMRRTWKELDAPWFHHRECRRGRAAPRRSRRGRGPGRAATFARH